MPVIKIPGLPVELDSFHRGSSPRKDPFLSEGGAWLHRSVPAAFSVTNCPFGLQQGSECEQERCIHGLSLEDA